MLSLDHSEAVSLSKKVDSIIDHSSVISGVASHSLLSMTSLPHAHTTSPTDELIESFLQRTGLRKLSLETTASLLRLFTAEHTAVDHHVSSVDSFSEGEPVAGDFSDGWDSEEIDFS